MQKAISKAKTHFLDLPAEVRNKIYSYLLSTKYTKVELTYHKQSLRVSNSVDEECHSISFIVQNLVH